MTSASAVSVTIYVDTSFFVSLYLPDRHTAEVERRLSARPSLWMTPLRVAEWRHALEQHVFRKAISRSEADRVLQRFQIASRAEFVAADGRTLIAHLKFARNSLTGTQRDREFGLSTHCT